MKNSPRPPHPSQRVLAVLASVLNTRDVYVPLDQDGLEFGIDDDAIQTETGYSRRSLERVWQELSDADAATVHPMPRGTGTRTIVSHPHEWWAWAQLEADLQTPTRKAARS